MVGTCLGNVTRVTNTLAYFGCKLSDGLKSFVTLAAVRVNEKLKLKQNIEKQKKIQKQTLKLYYRFKDYILRFENV